jgi:hypothetical protein
VHSQPSGFDWTCEIRCMPSSTNELGNAFSPKRKGSQLLAPSLVKMAPNLPNGYPISHQYPPIGAPNPVGRFVASPIRLSIHHAVSDFLPPLLCSEFPACLLPASQKLLYRLEIPSPASFLIQLLVTSLHHRPVAVYTDQLRQCLERG